MRDTTEATFETDRLIVHLKMTNRTWRYVQHYLTITGKTVRHPNARVFDINQQMWRAVIVDDPLIQRPNQIRTA